MDYREMKWTEQQGKIAKQLCREGKTAAEIGIEVGKTRNAVIGYLNRNGIRMSEAKDIVPKKNLGIQPIVKIRKIGVIHKKIKFLQDQPPDSEKIVPKPLRLQAYFAPKENGMGVPFLKASEGQCRFIVQERPAFVCGEPTKHIGCSWCEKHYEIVFTKPEPRNRSQERDNRSFDRRLGRH